MKAYASFDTLVDCERYCLRCQTDANAPGVRRRLLGRYDRHILTLGSAFDNKLHLAGDQCEQGVILTHADVLTRMGLGATLANDDAACVDRLTAIDLYAQAL